MPNQNLHNFISKQFYAKSSTTAQFHVNTFSFIFDFVPFFNFIDQRKMFPSSKTKLKFCSVNMSDGFKKTLEAKLPECLRNVSLIILLCKSFYERYLNLWKYICNFQLPSEKWKVELCRRIKECLDASNTPDDGPWHCAIGTKFAINSTNKGNGFAHIMVSPQVNICTYIYKHNNATYPRDTV